jgi:hypothetical protein
VIWPYVEVQSTIVDGDLPALAKHVIRNQSDNDHGSTAPILHADRIICGLRSLDRGTAFTAYLNASDEQNPSTITCTDAVGNFVNDVQSPTGRVYQRTNCPNADTSSLIWRINYSVGDEWRGRYHAFLRCYQTSGSSGDLEVWLRVFWGLYGGDYDTPRRIIPHTNDWAVVDFGAVTIPPGISMASGELAYIQIHVYLNGDGAVDIDIYDLILIPTDEWVGDFRGTSSFNETSIGGRRDADEDNTELAIDSVDHPRESIRALVTSKYLANTLFDSYQVVTNGPAIFQNNKQQRLWVLCLDEENDQANIEIGNSVQSWKVDRWESLRGAD